MAQALLWRWRWRSGVSTKMEVRENWSSGFRALHANALTSGCAVLKRPAALFILTALGAKGDSSFEKIAIWRKGIPSAFVIALLQSPSSRASFHRRDALPAHFETWSSPGARYLKPRLGPNALPCCDTELIGQTMCIRSTVSAALGTAWQSLVTQRSRSLDRAMAFGDENVASSTWWWRRFPSWFWLRTAPGAPVIVPPCPRSWLTLSVDVAEVFGW